MCICVWTEKRSLRSLADLRAAGLTIEPDDHDPDHGDDACLCGVDVEAILERSHVAYRLDEMGEPMVIGSLPDERENGG